MKKIVNYHMATALNNGSLVTEVKRLIQAGFQPYGTPFLSSNGYVVQAVVEYESETKLATDAELKEFNSAV